ncbi:EF-hand domain-containing protein [Algibacter sp. PT7-4]|uniref:EF-hand domain-containing protein n=1 Tax=Algibacter ulvanivorans TaxID=3400999 RepID=UPI003AAADC09
MKSTTLKLGTIAFAFFACSFSAQSQEKKAPNIDKRFKKIDTNDDGKITLDEFKAVKRKNEVPTDQLENRFKRMDQDSDGFVTLEELKTAMNKAKKKGKR